MALKRCLPLWIALSGPDRAFRSRPFRRRWHRCLPLLGEWGMRCDRLLVGRANRRDLHERHSSSDRDIVHPFNRDVTFSRSSVSAAVRWDIRSLAAQSRIRRYRSNHRVGTCSRMDSNRGTLIRHRETPFRTGPHPNWSECYSSGPQFIIIN